MFNDWTPPDDPGPDRSPPDPHDLHRQTVGNEKPLRLLVGMERFELSASCSQSRTMGVSGCVGLCRNLSEPDGLAGVMGAQFGTDPHRSTRPGAPRIDTSVINRPEHEAGAEHQFRCQRSRSNDTSSMPPSAATTTYTTMNATMIPLVISIRTSSTSATGNVTPR
jgi:hypothetical protein